MASTTVGLRLDEPTQERLKRLGEARDRSPHYLMKQAVEQFLVREEDVEAEDCLLNERWKKFVLTGETYTHKDAKARMENMMKSRRA